MARRGFRRPFYIQLEREGFSVMTLAGRERKRLTHCATLGAAVKDAMARDIAWQHNEYGEVDPALMTEYTSRYGSATDA